MASDNRPNGRASLPGPTWENAAQAKTWLIEQRRSLGWSHKELAKAFFACAVQSDLFIGLGGGALFDRATEKRIARFEREGAEIPEWMHWMPLAIQYAQVPWQDRSNWAYDNIPMNADLRREKEEAEINSRRYHLDDDEIFLIQCFRQLPNQDRKTLINNLKEGN